MTKRIVLSILSVLLICVFTGGCTCKKDEKKVLAKINNYEITKDEFDEEFKDSAFGMTDTPESRKQFLNSLIDRKLILQDAESRGLDKKKSFLKTIERLWEQALLKTALEIKAKDAAGFAIIGDREVHERYDKMVKEGTIDKPYPEVYNNIKMELRKEREEQLVGDWIGVLRRKADIKVDYDQLTNK